jgi:hypothetical protein
MKSSETTQEILELDDEFQKFITWATEGRGFAPFKPSLFYIDPLDWLILMTEECSYTVVYVNDYMELLYQNHLGKDVDGNDIEKIVGVKIKWIECLNKELFNKLNKIEG